MSEPLPAFLAAAVPSALREVSTWDADRRMKEADACADVIAGGADALFATPGKRDTVKAGAARAALARGLAILALRPCGVEFAGMTWTVSEAAGRWLIPDEVLSRHERGAFFTPREVAETVTAGALGPLTHEQPADRIEQLTVVDITCGAGAFLLAAARYLTEALVEAWDREGATETVLDEWGVDDVQLAARETALDCVYGVDVDPLSVALAGVAVQLLLPHTDQPPAALRHIRLGDALVGQVYPVRHDDVRYPEGVRRFDWHREFRNVFACRDALDGGFDAVIGNPPYLGGQKITGILGAEYREYLVHTLAHGVRGSADLAAYFWIRAAQVLSDLGTIGLITTNTLLQGATGRVCQACVDAQTYRTDNMRWPGTGAAVECVLVWCHRRRWIDPAWRSSPED